jgi:hypothetical protein
VEPVPAQQQRAARPRHPNGRPHPVGWVDQVARREAFEAAHPSVKIRPHVIGQPWTALVQMPDGSEATVTDFWELGGLLDKLDALRTANDRLAQPGDDG